MPRLQLNKVEKNDRLCNICSDAGNALAIWQSACCLALQFVFDEQVQ